MRTEYVAETDSTNRWLCEHGGDEDMVVRTDYQTEGRGCDNNSWESERGKNLLFSILYHPKALLARDQFIISMTVATAIRDVLETYATGFTIKWPNDIYHHDWKICGMLIENSVKGECIRQSIIGIGLNVNQQLFISNAPNPISLAGITGREVDCEGLFALIMGQITTSLEQPSHPEMFTVISDRYHQSLYRRSGIWPFRFTNGETHCCIIEGIDRWGRMHLCQSDNSVKRVCGFKEVQFII